MRKRKRQGRAAVRSGSIRRRLLLMLMVLLLLQTAVYLLVFFKGGVQGEARKNAFSIFREQTANRALDLGNDMVERWSNTREGENDVYAAVGELLDEYGLTAEALLKDSVLCRQLVADTAEHVIAMLRRNGVTGAFLVLDNTEEEGGRPGFYVRDYDPASYAAGNADLLLERGLPSVAREHGVALDSYWSAFFDLDDAPAPENQYFFAPLQAAAAVEPENRSREYFYHWSGRFRLSELDRDVITYSVPLIWEDGTLLGVLGIDVSCDYVAGQLRYQELGDGTAGAYFLGISRDGGTTYTTVCTSGANFIAWFGQAPSIAPQQTDQEGVVCFRQGTRTLYGVVQPLKLYNVNTPFEKEQWALVGLQNGAHLLASTQRIQRLILVSALVCLALGVCLMLLAARYLTKPLTNLVSALEKSDPDKPIRLPRLGMSEIDALTGAIENLSNSATESASRTSKILAMIHIPIGVFKYQKDGQSVFCSRSLCELMGWPVPEEDTYLTSAEFRGRMEHLRAYQYSGEPAIYRLPGEGSGNRWVQLTWREEGDTILGAFEDVTRDVEEKRRIEYERDFDILTDLYNRRAFDQQLRKLFSPARRGRLQVAALLMLDLDNLKYVNDTYGHDYGDRYIQAFAKCLESFYCCRSVVGRRSGDEFNVFLYGYENQEAVRACLKRFRDEVGEASLVLSTGDRMRVRASGGLAWYPRDAGNYEELLRMADFAMYSIKHTVKGRIQEFDREDYERNSILIQGQDALNRMIDGRLVRYALQPIVSVADGGVYGYEMLMRPQLEQLKDLRSLFLLAKAESKLLQIEELTWAETLAAFDRLDRTGMIAPGQRVFINSVASQCLTDEDLAALEQRYGRLLSRVVIEITEGEASVGNITSRKKHRAQLWNAQLALDDYGTGFNSEAVLMEYAPDLVKVDVSIIRGIDADPDRRDLLNSLIGYAGTRNIRVLAEGVETAAELETVIACGVDYIQGYYIARPDFEVRPIPARVQQEILTLYRKYTFG